MPGDSGKVSGVPLALVRTSELLHEARSADSAENVLNALLKLIRPDWVTEAVGWLTTSAICGDEE